MSPLGHIRQFPLGRRLVEGAEAQIRLICDCPLSLGRWDELQSSNPRHECLALHICFSSHAFELLLESYVCMETRREFVEVQEGLRLTVEDTGPLLYQSGHRAEPFK
jgi:hypothetical protein